MMRTVALLILCLLLPGCAHYEYDIIQPPQFAQHIGPAPVYVPIDPLVYNFESVDNRLIIRIENPTTGPIILTAEGSVIVDPEGQSHPLPPRTIAPHSFIRFILPPEPRVYYYDGPHGFYGGYWRGYRHFGYGFYWDGGPSYAVVYDTSSPAYFDWDDETDVRMTLAFRRGGKTFQHGFVFHRGKVR